MCVDGILHLKDKICLLVAIRPQSGSKLQVCSPTQDRFIFMYSGPETAVSLYILVQAFFNVSQLGLFVRHKLMFQNSCSECAVTVTCSLVEHRAAAYTVLSLRACLGCDYSIRLFGGTDYAVQCGWWHQVPCVCNVMRHLHAATCGLWRVCVYMETRVCVCVRALEDTTQSCD